jgi:ABC-2 type transport system permease protein
MALCGVNVPVSFYPTWLEWIVRCLPLTNGLEAIRGVVTGAPWSSIAGHAGAELLVGSVWFSLALATFGVFMRAGQRDGSLEYAA